MLINRLVLTVLLMFFWSLHQRLVQNKNTANIYVNIIYNIGAIFAIIKIACLGKDSVV